MTGFHQVNGVGDTAWGWNQWGNLGDGSTDNSSTPVRVDLPTGTRITAVAAGNGDESLALTSGGGALAWGFNEFGELGDGTTTNSSTPVRVHLPAGTRVTAVAADYADLALTSVGGVLAWGTGGELGNGTTTDSSTPVRLDLPPGTRVTPSPSAAAACRWPRIRHAGTRPHAGNGPRAGGAGDRISRHGGMTRCA
jgi:Regulator of chromosome condensation (RCC1) repeat